MDISLSYDIVLIFFFIAMIAGMIDTLAGGGGLLTIPALLLFNIPPLAALATNKFQACTGSFTASLTLWHKRAVSWRSIRIPFLASAIGSALGTIFVLLINADWLEWLIPVVLVSIAIYFVCFAKNQKKVTHRRFHPQPIFMALFPASVFMMVTRPRYRFIF